MGRLSVRRWRRSESSASAPLNWLPIRIGVWNAAMQSLPATMTVSPEWTKRAAGWMRVMHIDAFGAMLIYTFATVAFYLLGAATLNRAD